jgi:hypothetical protein
VGHAGLEDFETSVDELLAANYSRLVISCVAGTKVLSSVEHLGQHKDQDASLADGTHLKAHEQSSNWKNRELFEVDVRPTTPTCSFFILFIF